MILKLHHIAPKCILFFQKVCRGHTPDPRLKGDGKRGGEGKGKWEEWLGGPEGRERNGGTVGREG
jgi:hypothetical protein